MQSLDELTGTKWAGRSELWLDPLGHESMEGDCTIEVHESGIAYTWTHEGATKSGSVSVTATGGVFTDTFHSPSEMVCKNLVGNRGLFLMEGTYGDDSEWGWLIGLSLRSPTDELILQMTNIAPWGEEGRAVRFTCQRQ